jgi:hypothetical protein
LAARAFVYALLNNNCAKMMCVQHVLNQAAEKKEQTERALLACVKAAKRVQIS